MKLINISREEGHYIVNTLKTISVFGQVLYSWPKSYTRKGKNWVEVGSGKNVTGTARKKLDRWLKVHQKFIEKTS